MVQAVGAGHGVVLVCGGAESFMKGRGGATPRPAVLSPARHKWEAKLFSEKEARAKIKATAAFALRGAVFIVLRR